MAKNKISKIIAAIVVIGAVVVGGYAIHAHANGSSSKALVLSLSSTPPTMNPLYANSNSSLMVADVLYEPLYTMEQDGKISYNGLVKKIERSKDSKVYTVELKKDLKWSDGQPLTANDVVYTFNQIMNPKNNALLRQTFMIDNKPVQIKKINDTTVQFILPAASLGFMGNLSQLYPIPEHIYKNVKDLKTAPENKKPVGDGPYMFESEQAGSTVTLERNPNFFGPKAKIDKVVFRIIPNASAGIAALESGQLSAGYGSAKLLTNDKINGKYDVHEMGSGLVNTIVFNFNNKALSNLKVREAISYALNREALTKAEYGDSKYVKPAYSVFAPQTEYYNDNVTKFNYDLPKAKELMKQSGEKDVTLKLAYAAGFQWAQNQALVIKEDLAKIGIKVELDPIALNAFFQEIFTPNSKKYDMAINGYNMGQTPDGYSTVFTTGGANNASNFSNKKIDELFKQAQDTTSFKERADLYKEIQVELSKDIPVYTMNYPEDIILVSKNIDGVKEAKLAPISMFENLGELHYK